MANKADTYSEYFKGPIDTSVDVTEVIKDDLESKYSSGWKYGSKLGVSVDVEKKSDTEYIIRVTYLDNAKPRGWNTTIVSRNEYVFTLTVTETGLLLNLKGEYDIADVRAYNIVDGIQEVMEGIVGYMKPHSSNNSAAVGGRRRRGSSARKTYKGGRRRKTHKRGRKTTHKRR